MTTKIQFNKKILIILIIGGIALPIQMILTSMYPASEYSFTFGVALTIFVIIVAIMIALYSKARKEIPRE